jgi:Glutaredoxin-like domain (DUF836)
MHCRWRRSRTDSRAWRRPSPRYDPRVAPLPDLVLYTRTACSLCDEAREAIELTLADRRLRGLPVPALLERDIEADPELHRRYLERIPVVELGTGRVELVVTVGKLRRLLGEALDGIPSPRSEPVAR